jgi:hypothetical protein
MEDTGHGSAVDLPTQATYATDCSASPLQASGLWPRRCASGLPILPRRSGRQELGHPSAELVVQQHDLPPDLPLRWQGEERDQDGEDF